MNHRLHHPERLDRLHRLHRLHCVDCVHRLHSLRHLRRPAWGAVAGERTRRRCEPLKRYVAAIERLTDGLNATTVYLATDSEALLAEALRDYPQYRWLHYPPSLALGRSLNPTDRKWETRLRLDCRHSITVSQGPE